MSLQNSYSLIVICLELHHLLFANTASNSPFIPCSAWVGSCSTQMVLPLLAMNLLWCHVSVCLIRKRPYIPQDDGYEQARITASLGRGCLAPAWLPCLLLLSFHGVSGLSLSTSPAATVNMELVTLSKVSGQCAIIKKTTTAWRTLIWKKTWKKLNGELELLNHTARHTKPEIQYLKIQSTNACSKLLVVSRPRQVCTCSNNVMISFILICLFKWKQCIRHVSTAVISQKGPFTGTVTGPNLVYSPG